MSTKARVLSVSPCVLFMAFSLASKLYSQQPPAQTKIEARVQTVGKDGASLAVLQMNAEKPDQFIVNDKTLQDRVQGLKEGDVVNLEYALDEKSAKILKWVSVRIIPVGPGGRVWVLLVSALGLLAVAAICAGGNPFKFIVGQDGRYSNSKFQLAIWFFVLIVTYVAAIWLRWRAGCAWPDFIGGVNIPQNLLLLSGLSAFTFGAAKGITTAKVDDARLRAPGVDPKPPAGSPRFPSDLLRDDRGNLDIGDFQMIVIVLLAVGVYLGVIFKFLGSIELLKVVTLPDVDTTILASFGLGQGAYLVKKYAGHPGES